MEKDKLGLYAPWVICYRKLEALFKEDRDVTPMFNEKEKTLKLFISGQDKYDALSQLLPTEKDGLKIQIIPANNIGLSKTDLFRRAFSGNPVVTNIISIPREVLDTTNDFDYVIFKKEVVQYPSDSLNDPHGNTSTLYQFIAEDIFEDHGGIYFCTDKYES